MLYNKIHFIKLIDVWMGGYTFRLVTYAFINCIKPKVGCEIFIKKKNIQSDV